MKTVRLGLGCMRLSTDLDRDDVRASATVRAAFDAGARLFDTGRSYGRDAWDAGHNERLVARTLAEAARAQGVSASVRVVTKCGMRRDGSAWIADGRARVIADDAAASASALDGIGIDLMLLHAPDPRTPFSTSVRALRRVRDEGLARRIGVSNVTRRQLEEALAIAPIEAVQVALGAFHDDAARGGVIAFAASHGIEVIAHSPLGGPGRAGRLARDGALGRVAARHGKTAVEIFLAYLLAVHPAIVPIVGARRPETAVSALSAALVVLDEASLLELDARFPGLGAVRRPPPPPPTTTNRDVVVLMGIPGAGKSRAVAAWEAQKYERLNRDTLGGTLRGIARRLDGRLCAGATKLVLDNTYVTRVSRADVIRVAHANGARVRCIFFDTPVHEAQVNVVRRMVERYGELLDPEAMARVAKKDPNALGPLALQRMVRDLEPPAEDEGFDATEVAPFVRAVSPCEGSGALIVAFEALDRVDVGDVFGRFSNRPFLVFAWRPGADDAFLAAARARVEELRRGSGSVAELAVCAHVGGPPTCWCRPPLPGLLVAFAHRHGIDLRASTFVGTSDMHHTMAKTAGVLYEAAHAGHGGQR